MSSMCLLLGLTLQRVDLERIEIGLIHCLIHCLIHLDLLIGIRVVFLCIFNRASLCVPVLDG